MATISLPSLAERVRVQEAVGRMSYYSAARSSALIYLFRFFWCAIVFVLRNEAICFPVLGTTPLISATVDIRNTMLRHAKGREVLVEMVETVEGKDGEREKVEGGQKVGDEGVLWRRRGEERRKVGRKGRRCEARRGCGDCSLQMVMK